VAECSQLLAEYWPAQHHALTLQPSINNMPPLSDAKLRTSILLCLACVVEGADMAVLPALYFFIARSLHASPSQLGVLTLCRALMQAISSPLRCISILYMHTIIFLLRTQELCTTLACTHGHVGTCNAQPPTLSKDSDRCFRQVKALWSKRPFFWATHTIGIDTALPLLPCDAWLLHRPPHVAHACSGVLGEHRDRTTVIASGALLWSLCTVGISMSTSLVQACCFTTLNGLGLALVIPCAQSLMADYFPADQRGRAFGAMQLTMSFGSMVGSLVATNVASHEVRSAQHPSHILCCAASPLRTPSHPWYCSAVARSSASGVWSGGCSARDNVVATDDTLCISVLPGRVHGPQCGGQRWLPCGLDLSLSQSTLQLCAECAGGTDRQTVRKCLCLLGATS
jgi:hypothetical protein